MSETVEDTRPTLAELTTDQTPSTDADYLAWIERRIAEGQEQMKDPAKRIPAAKVWAAFGLDH